jgi:regulator of protease activity HflC (stomatin/prohibitin superfamily)
MDLVIGAMIGFFAWFILRYGAAGLYIVGQNERAVKTAFGRADRIQGASTLTAAIADGLTEEERPRYDYPQVRVIQSGGPYWKWPWEQIHKVSIATQTMNMATDLEDPNANSGGTVLQAVTKDQLNIGLSGQIRYRVSESNLYAYLFGVKRPIVHIMAYFISVLRERIANFEAKPVDGNLLAVDASTAGISINDLRKNLRDLNDHMERESATSAARYGVLLDASLITGIDPPADVESALAAINTAHNHVSSDISLAQAAADQRIVQSKRAVEIQTLNAHAEAEPLRQIAAGLKILKDSGPEALSNYVRSVRLKLLSQAKEIIMEAKD